MFSSISWPEFINAALWIVSTYYFITIPILYRREIIQKIKNRSTSTADRMDEFPQMHETLMGKVTITERPVKQTMCSDDAIIDVPPSQASFEVEQLDDISSDQIISELLTEIKILAKVNKESEATREEIFTTLKDLLSNYPHVQQSTRSIINHFIQEQYNGQLHLSESDLNSLWPSKQNN